MGFYGFSYGFPLVFLFVYWFSHGCYMILPFSHGFSYDFPMFLWVFPGFSRAPSAARSQALHAEDGRRPVAVGPRAE